MSNVDTFESKSTLTVGDTDYEIYRLDAVPGAETELLQHGGEPRRGPAGCRLRPGRGLGGTALPCPLRGVAAAG